MWGAMLHHWVNGSIYFVPSFPWVIQSIVFQLVLLDSKDEGPMFHWNIGSPLPTDVASHCRRTKSFLSLVTRLLAGRSGARIQVGVTDFFFSKMPRPAVGPIQPPFERVLGLKRLGREVNHSASPNADH